MAVIEALDILRKNRIPFHKSRVKGVAALMKRNEVDCSILRKHGFRISHIIGNQSVVFYKGGRFGLIV